MFPPPFLSAAVNQHGQTSCADPEILTALAAREQNPLVLRLLTQETNSLFFSALLSHLSSFQFQLNLPQKKLP
jgi:hypothetical protein